MPPLRPCQEKKPRRPSQRYTWAACSNSAVSLRDQLSRSPPTRCLRTFARLRITPCQLFAYAALSPPPSLLSIRYSDSHYVSFCCNFDPTVYYGWISKTLPQALFCSRP